MQSTVTLTPTQTFTLAPVQQDINGVDLPAPDPNFSSLPTYVSSDPTVATIGGNPPHYVQPTGKIGSTTVTASESNGATPPTVIAGTLIVNVPYTGPAAVSLRVGGVVVGT